ncbi:MAG: nitrogenase component 1 [Bacillota bacterium]
MTKKYLSLSMLDLKENESLLRNKNLFSHCLHFTPPSFGGWGIVRVGMLVPGAVMLFVAPPACGRHGAIAGIQLGFKHRLYYFYVDEVDLVIGKHMELVEEAVEEILGDESQRTEALIICISCVDYLLGSDFDSLVKELEDKYGIPVRLAYMNPIALEGKTPPQHNIQKTIYSFVPPSETKDKGINVIGNFAAIQKNSEIYELLEKAGFEGPRHISDYERLESLKEMGRSAYNLLIRPEGKLAGKYMQEHLGIPFCFLPVSYSLFSIDKNYNAMEEFLGVALDRAPFRQQAFQAIEDAKVKLGSLKIAVSSTANAMPFEISRALTEFGFQVTTVFCDEIIDADLEHLAWLQEHSPDIKVFTNIHPGMADFKNEGYEVDMAIGFTAGYYLNCSKTVPLTLDEQPYGYRAISYLLNCMIQAWEKPQDLKTIISEAAIVV